MKQFRGRVAVVTGGAGGIGKALAKAFLGEGMKVVIADVEAPALEAAAKELGASGGDVTGVVTDVSSVESVQALADRVFDTHGACHLLCNNAGVSVANLDLWDLHRHTFSHYHLDIQPALVRLEKTPNTIMEARLQLWYNSARPESVGLAAPISRLLDKFGKLEKLR